MVVNLGFVWFHSLADRTSPRTCQTGDRALSDTPAVSFFGGDIGIKVLNCLDSPFGQLLSTSGMSAISRVFEEFIGRYSSEIFPAFLSFTSDGLRVHSHRLSDKVRERHSRLLKSGLKNLLSVSIQF